MEGRSDFDSLDHASGLQELMYTDFDQWICQLNARLSSRLSTDDSTCKTASTAKQQKTEDCTEIQPISEAKVPLQEIFVNGLLVAQKTGKAPVKNKNNVVDFLNTFKKNDDYTNYDFVLLTLVNENARKNLHKYIRSKI